MNKEQRDARKKRLEYKVNKKNRTGFELMKLVLERLMLDTTKIEIDDYYELEEEIDELVIWIKKEENNDK